MKTDAWRELTPSDIGRESEPPKDEIIQADWSPHDLDGRIPVDVAGTFTVGGTWARRLARAATRLAPIGQVLGKLLVGATWTVLIVGAALVATGRADAIGLSRTSAAYQPIHVALGGLALLVIGLITGDVIAAGRRSTPRTRRRRARRAVRGGETVRVSFVGQVDLPDNPDLRSDPNGFTGTGTQVPGASQGAGLP